MKGATLKGEVLLMTPDGRLVQVSQDMHEGNRPFSNHRLSML